MSEFSQKLKNLRKKSGLTQAEVALKTGMSPSAVGMYEQGRREPDFETVQKFCELYSVTPNYLVKSGGDAPAEVNDVINTIREQMKQSQGLMFNGVPVTEADTERIFDAMLLAARLILSGEQEAASLKKENSKCDNMQETGQKI